MNTGNDRVGTASGSASARVSASARRRPLRGDALTRRSHSTGGKEEELLSELLPLLVEQIAQRAAEIVIERLESETGSPWMTRKQAAEYLNLPLSNLEQRRDLPLHRTGHRVLYHRGELDRFLLGAGKDASHRSWRSG
jgi:hypothetical protein